MPAVAAIAALGVSRSGTRSLDRHSIAATASRVAGSGYSTSLPATTQARAVPRAHVCRDHRDHGPVAALAVYATPRDSSRSTCASCARTSRCSHRGARDARSLSSWSTPGRREPARSSDTVGSHRRDHGDPTRGAHHRYRCLPGSADHRQVEPWTAARHRGVTRQGMASAVLAHDLLGRRQSNHDR
jgi:hypothetical protein